MTAQESNSPFFSVIIPTHNRASLIHLPIESILRQTFTDWELIMVDDGSTDNTKQVIASYTDARIRYIYQQDLERSAARNNGIAQAKGQYLCFLDDDDYYFPEHLASFHQKIAEHNYPVAVFYCNTIEDRDGKLIPFHQPKVQTANNVEWFSLPRWAVRALVCIAIFLRSISSIPPSSSVRTLTCGCACLKNFLPFTMMLLQ